tara:strand:+ start:1072 stop:1536 length:465 start_codon:yes stop_codon:yes gene_type:complete
MWQDKLKEIIYILENSNVNEIEVTFWGKKYRVSKQPNSITQDSINPTLQTNLVSNNLSNENKENQELNSNVNQENSEELLSPMPGTFYSSPTPDDDPFVKVGDKVVKGEVLCIVEAMKIMNEIESEFDGAIIDIKVENGEPVEYNQPLFVISPT